MLGGVEDISSRKSVNEIANKSRFSKLSGSSARSMKSFSNFKVKLQEQKESIDFLFREHSKSIPSLQRSITQRSLNIPSAASNNSSQAVNAVAPVADTLTLELPKSRCIHGDTPYPHKSSEMETR